MSEYIDQQRRHLSRIGRIFTPGSHVTGWAALVPQWGAKAEHIYDSFLTAFAQLQLDEVYFSGERVHLAGLFSEGREQLIIHKRVGKDNRAVRALITIRVEGNERGDMLAGWFLFEKDRTTPLRQYLYALVAAMIGYAIIQLFSSLQVAGGATSFLLLTILVVGFFIGKGLGLWGRLYNSSPATPYERMDSAVLARYVDVTLKQVLSVAGVDAGEINELRFSDASWIEDRLTNRVTK